MLCYACGLELTAKACGLEDKIGTIEEGKLADIIIVDGNPLENIKILQDLQRIKM